MDRLLASLVMVVAAVAGGTSAPFNSLSVGAEECYYAEAELPPYEQEVRVCRPRAGA